MLCQAISIKYFFITIFIFLYIYTPLVILPFNVMHLIALFSLFLLSTKYKSDFYCIRMSNEFSIFIIIHFILLLFAVSMSLFAGALATAFYPHFVVIFEIIPSALFISFFLIRNNFDTIDVYRVILLVGVLQVICVILTMLFPSLREQIISSSGSEALGDTFDKLNLFRIYGIARGYTFSMPLFQGLCVIISYVLGSFRSKYYYLLIPFYVLSIVVNARTPTISIVIAVLVVSLFTSKANLIKVLIVLFFLSYLLIQLIHYNADNSPVFSIWTWLEYGIIDISNLISGDKTGNIEALADSMWFFPDFEDFMFGTGKNVFLSATEIGGTSDIGYVQNIYFGGIFYSFLLYFSYTMLSLKVISSNTIDKCIIVSALVYLFIANFKGNSFMPQDSINGFMLIVIFIICSRIFSKYNYFNKKNACLIKQ